MIRLNDQCYVAPMAIMSVSVNDRGDTVQAYVAELGNITVKPAYGEGVYTCAERIAREVGRACNPPDLSGDLADLGTSIRRMRDEVEAESPKDRGEVADPRPKE